MDTGIVHYDIGSCYCYLMTMIFAVYSITSILILTKDSDNDVFNISVRNINILSFMVYIFYMIIICHFHKHNI